VKEQVGPRCFIESDPNIMKRVSSEEYVNVMANIIFLRKVARALPKLY
jgi:hypothetical protein